MREQYPFFREEDERARAVIGADAAEADLNGEYQKPYAILTRKRLYCKNETGNFITQSADLLKAGNDLLPIPNRFLWFAVICIVLAVGIEWGIAWDLRERFNWGLWWARWCQGYGLAALVWIAEGVVLCGGSVAAIIMTVEKKLQSVNKLILVIAFVEVVCNVIWFWLYGLPFDWDATFRVLLITWCILAAILSVLAVIFSILGIMWGKRYATFFITHSAGAFSFNPGLYSSAELKYFAAQVKALKAGDANGQ